MPLSKSKASRPAVCVDFDRVLHDIDHPVEGRRMGPPMLGALEAMTELEDRGFELVCFTIRGAKAHIYQWLEFYGFPEMLVTNIKPDALIYIDDRGYRFSDWATALPNVFALLGVDRD